MVNINYDAMALMILWDIEKEKRSAKECGDFSSLSFGYVIDGKAYMVSFIVSIDDYYDFIDPSYKLQPNDTWEDIGLDFSKLKEALEKYDNNRTEWEIGNGGNDIILFDKKCSQSVDAVSVVETVYDCEYNRGCKSKKDVLTMKINKDEFDVDLGGIYMDVFKHVLSDNLDRKVYGCVYNGKTLTVEIENER